MADTALILRLAVITRTLLDGSKEVAMLRTYATGGAFVALLVGIVAFVPARGAPLVAVSAAEAAEAPARGCYLNFVARNAGSQSVFIDIGQSRIRSWGPVYTTGSYTKIEKTSSQNIRAGETRHFTVWAKLCGIAGLWHDVRFVLKQGIQTKSVTARHDGKNETVSLGNINAFFN